ncbi:MAG: dihydroorotate dehydrogenase electron transfer subunit [Desulfurellaceae bacterium]|nr:dihydroorotate dehydrogenase electron transfer subunit [Desulfurellaceae bacterium]
MKAVISSNSKIAKDIFVLNIKTENPIKAEPGQFVMIKVSNTLDPYLRRPFSIAQIEEKSVTFFYKIVGKGTNILSELKQGKNIDLLCPLGNSFKYKGIKQAALVAGGMGAAPLLFLAQRLAENNIPFKFFWGTETKDELFTSRYDFLYSTMDGSKGFKGDVVKLFSLNKTAKHVFCCGPSPMLYELFLKQKQEDFELYVSVENMMGCGFGVCLGCVIDTREGKKRVCKDGPVFKAEDITWNKIV